MPHRLTALLAVLLTAQPLRGQDSVPPVPPAPMAPTAPGPVSVPVTLPVVPAPRAPTVAAPEPPVFTSLEVDAPPVLDSVQTWYFPKGKLDRSARVVFQAIVDTSGRIEPATIRLVSTTDSSFVPAARLTLMVSYSRPATARGERGAGCGGCEIDGGVADLRIELMHAERGDDGENRAVRAQTGRIGESRGECRFMAVCWFGLLTDNRSIFERDALSLGTHARRQPEP